MKQLLTSMSRHPVWTAIISSMVAFIGTFAGSRPDLLHVLVPALMVLLWIVGMLLWIDRKIILIALSLSMVVPAKSQEAKPPPETECGPFAAGVVVILIGATAYYTMSRFCQRHFPAQRPENTNELSGASCDTHAVAYNYSNMGSCLPENPCYDAAPPDGRYPTSVTRSFLVDGVSNTHPTITFASGDSAVQNWENYTESMEADYGIRITGECCSLSFACNGEPVDELSSPIRVDQNTRRVYIGNDGDRYNITVERSTNLRSWIPMLDTDVEGGTTVFLNDVGYAHAFYRYQVSSAQ